MRLKKDMSQFFDIYKNLEDKWVKIKRWQDVGEAYSQIMVAHKRFKEKD